MDRTTEQERAFWLQMRRDFLNLSRASTSIVKLIDRRFPQEDAAPVPADTIAYHPR